MQVTELKKLNNALAVAQSELRKVQEQSDECKRCDILFGRHHCHAIHCIHQSYLLQIACVIHKKGLRRCFMMDAASQRDAFVSVL